MKKAASLLIAVLILASCGKPNLKVKLKTENDSISYLIGLSIAKNIKSSDMEKINPEAVARAFNEVFKGDSIKITDQEIQMKIQAYFMKLQSKAGEKNLKEGNDFLEKNKKKDGVITLPSGLQYQVIKQGNGPKPDSTDMVAVNYTGTLINGEKFDSNAASGQPAKFPVTGVIPGWTQALTKMAVGSKWKLFIPAHLAFGERGAGGKIKPNMALIFEVELLSIEPKTKDQSKDPKAAQLKK